MARSRDPVSARGLELDLHVGVPADRHGAVVDRSA
jgi:hypothetical protein